MNIIEVIIVSTLVAVMAICFMKARDNDRSEEWQSGKPCIVCEEAGR